MPGRNLEERYNVSTVWKGEEDKDELMLMAHTDTVEIGNPANWEFYPLSGEIKDGKIFGRGACDYKYAIATALFTVKLLKEFGFKPKKNLVFVAYSDEELGGSHGALAGVLKNPCDNIVSMDGRDGKIWHCASGGGETSYLFHTKNIVDSAKLTASAFPVVMGDYLKNMEANTLTALVQAEISVLKAVHISQTNLLSATSLLTTQKLSQHIL